MKFARITMAVAALALAACGDDNGTGPGENSDGYNITITGAVQATAKGQAWFGADEDFEGNEAFVIMLGSETSTHTILLGREGTTRPAVGTYTITDGELEDGSFSGLYIQSVGEEGMMYFTQSGTIQVTESTSSRLKGTIQLQAVSLFGDPEDPSERVTITGSFDARKAAGSMVMSMMAR